MSNISSTIFQVGYKYSADRFLWRNSKLCKCLPQELKVEVRKLFDNYVIKWCSLDIFSEEFLKNELVALKELQRKLSHSWRQLGAEYGDEVSRIEFLLCVCLT